MRVAKIILPNQLFYNHSFFDDDSDYYLVEEYLFFRQYCFHKIKIAFHRASMRRFNNELSSNSKSVTYVEAQSNLSRIENLVGVLDKKYDFIEIFNPVDDWLNKRIKKSILVSSLKTWDNPSFINSNNNNKSVFTNDKHKYLHANFYKKQRLENKILVSEDRKPIGGKWSFDEDNRKKLPKNASIPKTKFEEFNEYWEEAFIYTELNFGNNYGDLNRNYLFPISPENAEKWLKGFLEKKFELFGPYEDAISKNDSFLYHSMISPLLNIGLVNPKKVIKQTLLFSHKNNIPINSTEGFIRQIIGWREFIRGIYEEKGRKQRTLNYWQFKRKIPKSFYDGTTGIEPVDETIKKLLKSGYNHHIERLMILGNFMLLCEFDPDEVYKWFMEMYIDSYDWVMVPNVYGMSQFADGGIFATKPYISGSNYILKMSDYKKCEWSEIWNGLYWRFIDKQRWFFSQNFRLKLMVNSLDKMDSSKRENLFNKANNFLEKLDKQNG